MTRAARLSAGDPKLAFPLRRRLASSLLACVLAVVAGAVAPRVLAHAPQQSYVFLRIGEAKISGRFEITAADANAVLGLGLPTDRPLTREDLDGRTEPIAAYLLDRVRFAPDGSTTRARIDAFDVFETSFAQFVQVSFTLAIPDGRPAFIDVDYGVFLDELPGHAGLLVVADDWQTSTFANESLVSLTFSGKDRSQRLDLSAGSLWQGLAGMIELGAHHILIGFDHILFLFALLLPCVLFRENGHWEPVPRGSVATWNVVKIVTLFTLAHSITLGVAGLGLVDVPSRLVESVIALSIAIAALDILFPVLGRRIGWIVFGFGLFHGFGFATVLGEVGVYEEFLVLTLLGFNLGVEFGQLAIVAAGLPLLLLLRRWSWYRSAVLPACAIALIAVAVYWFTERAFDIDLPAGSMLKAALRSLS